MDEVDRANDLAQTALETTLAKAREAANNIHAGRIDCEDCEDEIPAQRRAIYPAATRCVACQERHEFVTKRR